MEENQKPLVNKEYQLEKYPGKGGWTYAAIPEIPADKHAHFGWVKVKGSIDHYAFRNYRLMPMGSGKMFFPVRAEIRKQIEKNEGDWVRIVLYKDDAPAEVPDELILCLKTDPDAYSRFQAYTDQQKKDLVEWIYSAKTDAQKVERIAGTIQKLSS